MANIVFGLGYTQFTCNYYNYYGIMTKEPITYNDFQIHITALSDLFPLIKSNNNEAYNNVHSQLKKVKPGTNVLFSLGLNCLKDFNPIVVFIGKLADKYPQLNFYAVSLVGVNEGLCNILNADIRDFNAKMENRIKIVEFTNLKYKSILFNENPCQIMVDGKVVDILNYASEGTGFFKNGYVKLFRALVEDLY